MPPQEATGTVTNAAPEMGSPAFLRGGELPSSTKRIAALLLRHVSRYPKFTGIYPLADRGLKVFPVDAGSNLGRKII